MLLNKQVQNLTRVFAIVIRYAARQRVQIWTIS